MSASTFSLFRPAITLVEFRVTKIMEVLVLRICLLPNGRTKTSIRDHSLWYKRQYAFGA